MPTFYQICALPLIFGARPAQVPLVCALAAAAGLSLLAVTAQLLAYVPLLGGYAWYLYWVSLLGAGAYLVGVGQVQALEHALTHRLKQLKALLDDRRLHLTALEFAA